MRVTYKLSWLTYLLIMFNWADPIWPEFYFIKS